MSSLRFTPYLLTHADALLRSGRSAPSVRWLVLTIFVFGMTYGAVMGTYNGLAGDRWQQVIYSSLKVPLLLLITFALSLPSLFVLHSVLGLSNDFREAVRALLSAQAGLAIILASLAPLTAVWYASVPIYPLAILFNALMFGVASVSGQLLLRRFYRCLIARNPRHRLMMRLWLLMYAFVGIQMGWVLRPFIGSAGMPPQLFREGAWSNAYVHLAGLIASMFR